MDIANSDHRRCWLHRFASVRPFLIEGHSVIGMDNLITGNVRNIAHLAGNPHFLFVKHDVTNYIYVSGEVDAVLHFASPASPIDYLKYPIPTLKVGALGTHNALGLALAKGARFLLASTSEVYGDPLQHPQREDYAGNVDPIGPRGVYDEAKRYAEALTMAYHRAHGLDTRIVRIFNTYGPRMRLDDGRVVPNFIGQALRGEAADRLWRWIANPQFPVCRRPGRRRLPPADEQLQRAGQHRHVRRNDASSNSPSGSMS